MLDVLCPTTITTLCCARGVILRTSPNDIIVTVIDYYYITLEGDSNEEIIEFRRYRSEIDAWSDEFNKSHIRPRDIFDIITFFKITKRRKSECNTKDCCALKNIKMSTGEKKKNSREQENKTKSNRKPGQQMSCARTVTNRLLGRCL